MRRRMVLGLQRFQEISIDSLPATSNRSALEAKLPFAGGDLVGDPGRANSHATSLRANSLLELLQG